MELPTDPALATASFLQLTTLAVKTIWYAEARPIMNSNIHARSSLILHIKSNKNTIIMAIAQEIIIS